MRHKNVVVDGQARTVICSDCGFVLDPFDYMMDWATEGDRRMQALREATVQRRVAETEIASLETRIKNARATLRRCGQPQPDDERRLFRDAKNNWEQADKILAPLVSVSPDTQSVGLPAGRPI